MPEMLNVSAVIGEDILESIGEIINLHDELKGIIKKYAELEKQRIEIAEVAMEYLKTGLNYIPPDKNRIYIIQGIENEMLKLFERAQQIKEVFSNIFISNPKTENPIN